MNDWFPSAAPTWAATPWQLAGWTMLHFLWAGTVVAAAGAAARGACRRAGPNVRYTISLGTLLVLTATPVGVAVMLSGQGSFSDEVAETAPPEFRRNSATVGAFLRNSQGGAVDGIPPMTIELLPDATVGNPSPSPSLRGRGNDAPLARLIEWLPAIWLVGTPVTFAMLAAGIVGSRRLRRTSSPLVEGPIVEACRRLERALGATRRAALAVCEGLAQPVLVGIVKPTILLPAAALTGWSPEELEMVLVHELAHVRRWDNLVNLGQRVIESLLFFHPAVWLASRQVRRDREECCDAAVVRHTRSPEAYATLLVSIATSLRGRPAAALAVASAMANHALASRVRRILKLEDQPMWITRRMLCLLVVLALGLSGAVYRAAFAVPAPVVAEETAQNDAEVAGDSAVQEGETDAKPQAAEEDKPYILVYRLSEMDQFNGKEWLRLFGGAEKKGVEFQWHEDSKGMIVSAPRDFHEQLSSFLRKTRGEDRTFAELKADLAKLEAQHIDIEKELAELEVLKEVAQQSGVPGRPINALVEIQLDKDPTIKMYQEQLFTLSQQIQQLATGARNENNAQLRRLQAQYQQTEGQLAQYRQSTEKELRERLRNLPNEALRAAIAEYNVRKAALQKAKAELERQIDEIEAKLLDLARDELGEADEEAIGNPEGLPDAGGGDAPARAGGAPIIEATPENDYRYDGKTFDQWRNAWRYELMTEKRIEAVEALAAFGRSAYPQEAAEAIFDVAEEYDFSWVGNDGEGKLKEAVLRTFSKERAAIAPEVWLPLLVARMKAAEGAEQRRWSSLLTKLLDRWRYKMAKPPELLLELAASEELGVREAAVCALVRGTEDIAELDPQALQLVRSSLTGERPSMRVLQELQFAHLEQVPEQLDVLLEADPRVQTEARALLNAVSQNSARPPEPYEPVLAVALGTDRTENRVAALRALAAMSPYLNRQQPKELGQELWKLLTETEEKQLLAPTMLVLKRMYGFRDRTLIGQLQQIGAPEVKDISPERLTELQFLANNTRDEEQIVFPNGE